MHEAIGAQRVEPRGSPGLAELSRTHWRAERSRSPRIEGMFGCLEAVLHSEVSNLGHLRAALLDFAPTLPAYNVLSPAATGGGAGAPAATRRAACPDAGSVLLPLGPAGQGRLRGPAYRPVARPMAALGPGRSGRPGPAPAPSRPHHQPAAGRIQQARIQDRQAQWLCR